MAVADGYFLLWQEFLEKYAAGELVILDTLL
jgi:hypothetical protein